MFSLARVRGSGREFISEVGNSHFFLGDFAPTRIIRVSGIARCPPDECTVKGLECISNESQTERGLRSVVQ